MTISPINLNGMLQRTDDVGVLKHQVIINLWLISRIFNSRLSNMNQSLVIKFLIVQRMRNLTIIQMQKMKEKAIFSE